MSAQNRLQSVSGHLNKSSKVSQYETKNADDSEWKDRSSPANLKSLSLALSVLLFARPGRDPTRMRQMTSFSSLLCRRPRRTLALTLLSLETCELLEMWKSWLTCSCVGTVTTPNAPNTARVAALQAGFRE